MPKKESLDKFIRQGLVSYPDAMVTLREFEGKIQAPCEEAIKSLRDIITGKSSKEIVCTPGRDTEWVGVELKTGSLQLCAGISWDGNMKKVMRWASVGAYFNSIEKAKFVRDKLTSLGKEPDEPAEDDKDGKYAVWISRNIKVANMDGIKKAIQQSLKGWTTVPNLRKILRG